MHRFITRLLTPFLSETRESSHALLHLIASFDFAQDDSDLFSALSDGTSPESEAQYRKLGIFTILRNSSFQC